MPEEILKSEPKVMNAIIVVINGKEIAVVNNNYSELSADGKALALCFLTRWVKDEMDKL